MVRLIEKGLGLMEFSDFASKAGPTKLTAVRKMKSSEYTQGKDHWRRLRSAIVDMHRDDQPTGVLDEVIAATTPRRRESYEACVRAYTKYLDKHDVSWFKPPKAIWEHDGLEVRVTPELGLVIDGSKTIAKLYFTKKALPRNKLAIALHLMESALDGADDAVIAVMDVPRRRLLSSKGSSAVLQMLLEAEARTLQSLWD